MLPSFFLHSVPRAPTSHTFRHTFFITPFCHTRRVTAFIMPTVNCLVELIEMPFTVISLGDIEVGHTLHIQHNCISYV